MFHCPRARLFAVVVSAAAAVSLQAAEPFGLRERVPIGPFLNHQLPPVALMQTGNWMVVEAFPNLEIDDPTAIEPEPGTNRLYVATRQGEIFWFVNEPEVSGKTLFLDLTDVTQGWDDCGLMGFAFHPEFGRLDSTNRGYVYVWYHYSPAPIPGPRRPPVNTPGYNRLSRFTVPDGWLVADRSSEQVLINQFDRNVWHDGGGMFFGDDGFLYLGLGDEGNSFDFYGNAQTIRRGLFSGMLRIDVDCDPARSHPIRRQPEQAAELPPGFTENSYTANYFIPNDNPFLDPDGGVMEEFWAVGLRNPHRATLDRSTGRIWVGDIGQNLWEEVDVIERGGNYQWPYREGFQTVTNRAADGPIARPTAEAYLGVERPPLHDYYHGAEGKCVIGGYVYRGREFEEDLGGKYIFGDNASGRIWALDWDGTNAPAVEYLCNMPPGVNYTGLSTFGIDQDNELYIGKMGRPSRLYKLARADALARSVSITFAVPDRLSGLGAFTNLAALEPAPGIIPYEVNSPLWSDDALKRRWIAVPQNDAVRFAAAGEWSFPAGTVFIKHFEIPVNEVTGEIRRLETRFLVRDNQDGVYGFTYRWRRNHSEAELVSNGTTDTISITTASGIRTQEWFYPGPLDCLVCHTPNAGHVLGVNARQLNCSITYPDTGVADNQLRAWNHAGFFDTTIAEAILTNVPALARIDDMSAPIEHRVRSYLDANCAQCHRPNGAAGYFDARFDTPLAEQGIVNGPLANAMGLAGAQVVSPGSLSNSVLHVRIGLAGGNLQMPPLAKNVVDTNAVVVIGEWIESLRSAPAAR